MPNRLESKHRAMLASVIAEQRFDDDYAVELDVLLWESVCDEQPDFDRPLTIPIPRAMYYAAFWLEAEVNNGGFDQFFSNKGPRVALCAMDFLKACGPAPVLGLLDQAIALMPQEWREATCEDALDYFLDEEDEVRSEAMQALDLEFYELDLIPSFAECRLRLAAEHPAAFFV